MNLAINQRRDYSTDFASIQQEVNAELLKSEAYSKNFGQDIDSACNDPRLPESIRAQLNTILENVVAMKSSIFEPRGPADTFRGHVSLLSEKQRWYIERLRAELGMARRNEASTAAPFGEVAVSQRRSKSLQKFWQHRPAMSLTNAEVYGIRAPNIEKPRAGAKFVQNRPPSQP